MITIAEIILAIAVYIACHIAATVNIPLMKQPWIKIALQSFVRFNNALMFVFRILSGLVLIVAGLLLIAASFMEEFWLLVPSFICFWIGYKALVRPQDRAKAEYEKASNAEMNRPYKFSGGKFMTYKKKRSLTKSIQIRLRFIRRKFDHSHSSLEKKILLILILNIVSQLIVGDFLYGFNIQNDYLYGINIQNEWSILVVIDLVWCFFILSSFYLVKKWESLSFSILGIALTVTLIVYVIYGYGELLSSDGIHDLIETILALPYTAFFLLFYGGLNLVLFYLSIWQTFRVFKKSRAKIDANLLDIKNGDN